MSKLRSLIKAARIYRTLPVLMVMMVSVAFANYFTKSIMYLALTCVLIYAAAGLHNAIKDKDYILPNYSKFVIIFLVVITIIISLQDLIVFFTGIAWIFLGLIYNTITRRVLFGDATILSVTHFALPSFSSSLLLGIDKSFALTLAGFMFITTWFIIHSKNLKDTMDDKKRGYRTLTTIIKSGKTITIILLWFSFIPMLFAYFLFNLTTIYLLILFFIFILGLIITKNILKSKEDFALKLARVIVMLFLFGLIASKAVDIKIVFFALCLFFVYGLFLIASVVKYLKSSKWVWSYTKQD